MFENMELKSSKDIWCQWESFEGSPGGIRFVTVRPGYFYSHPALHQNTVYLSRRDTLQTSQA
jgi:hypothetical protein